MGADTLVQRAGYDAYVVMLHDQGHVAAKALAPQRIAALTLGTPVLFSSVGHGSALDIAGRGVADATAMREAITWLVGRF
jgi:4-hydroxythreonine-4-phosphate dehydrogenase